MLLEKLGHVWVQFYTSILPTLQAFFAPIQVNSKDFLVLNHYSTYTL